MSQSKPGFNMVEPQNVKNEFRGRRSAAIDGLSLKLSPHLPGL